MDLKQQVARELALTNSRGIVSNLYHSINNAVAVVAITTATVKITSVKGLEIALDWDPLKEKDPS